MNNTYSQTTFFYLVANSLVLAIVGFAAILNSHFPDLYYFSIQEDEYLEWATFWGFLLAVAVNLNAAHHYHNATKRFPWFLLGLALFCFLVAMEEVSWGQRVFGYRPPAYFLEQNFQQELNLHNVVDRDYRKLVLKLIIVGYGVVLPLVTLFPFVGRALESIGITAPPIGLVPAFAATSILYISYPWSHSGEWVESMMAFGFLFVALEYRRRFSETRQVGPGWSKRIGTQAVIGGFMVVIFGLANGALSRAQREGDSATLQTARVEIEALRRDFQSGEVKSRCNRHKRLYAFVQKYDQEYLYRGEFAGLQAQGLPAARAEFLIDPWNSPYWIRDRCVGDSKRRIQFVYSFGPNRRRDSSRSEILGDDVGTYIIGNDR